LKVNKKAFEINDLPTPPPRQCWVCEPPLIALKTRGPLVTGGGLQFDQVPRALGQGVNDNAAQVVGELLWVLWCLTLSMGALGVAYLGRAAWKMGRGKARPVSVARTRRYLPF